MSKKPFRKHLSMSGMPNAMRACLDRIPDPINPRGPTLADFLVSGLAVFSPKMPSPLRFGTQVRGGRDPVQAWNPRSPFGIGKPPSDSWIRGRPDGIDPRSLRRCLGSVHAVLRRGKVP